MKTITKSRLLLALAAVVMLPAFVTPLWSIRLVAPQYPEGLGMHIYVSDVRGHERHDIQNINILNHYIGMQPIEPEAIPELEIMPVVLGALAGTGLLVALVGGPWLMAGWLGLFLVAGVAGMIDFYLWNIDYGHNLSPDAAIRIPDMTYSPPIIGSAQILNIRASSYPHLGSLFLALSALLAGAAVVLGFRGRAPRSATLALGVLLAVVAAGCAAPEQEFATSDHLADGDRIVYGESEDPHCGETVEEVRWGGELRTVTGERLRFRSVECLAGYLLEERIPAEEVAAVKVVDFPDGWRLVDASEATFLHTPNLSGPTRLDILAIEADKMVVNLHAAYTGDLLDWDGVLALVARENGGLHGPDR